MIPFGMQPLLWSAPADVTPAPTGYGPNLCSGGTPFGSPGDFGTTLAAAFDGTSSLYISTTNPTVLGYLLPTAKRVGKLTLLANPAWANEWFGSAAVQGSADTTTGTDGTWATLLTGLTMTGSSSPETFLLPTAPLVKAVRVRGAPGGRGFIQIAEMTLHEALFT